MENSISDLFKIIDQNLKEYVIVYDFIEDELIYVSSNIDNYSKNRKVEKLTDVLSLFLCEDDSKKFVESLMLRLKNYVDGDSTLSNMYKVQKFSKCESPKDNFEQLEIYSKIIEKEGAVYWFINILDISSHKKELQKKEDLIKELTESKRELHQVRSALIKRNQILNDLTIKDDLTGAYNRYYFDNIFREEIERNDRHHNKISLIILDIDKFKRINDTYGHSKGDIVLSKIAETIKSIIKTPDIFARWGGEEFVILLPQTSITGAYSCAERLRRSIENIDYGEIGTVTASFGVVEKHYNEGEKKLFKRADKLLYQAKEKGRNRVEKEEELSFTPIDSLSFTWKTKWNSPNREINLQHRYLLTLINNLNFAYLSNGEYSDLEKIINKLYRHIKYHFYYEEKILEKVGYKELEAHKKEHEKLMEKAEVFYQKFLDSTLEYQSFFDFVLNKLIMDHLINHDLKYFSYL